MKKHNDQPIHEVLKNMMQSGPLKAGYYDSQVKRIWNQGFGKLLAEQTLKIFFNKGIVYITLSSSPLRNELLMGKQKLIDTFNKELGSTIVNDIVLR